MSRNTNSNNIIEPNNTGRADLTPQELILLSRDLFYAVTTRLPIEDIRNLIDRGADVNTVTHGYTLLHSACINENPEIATLLLERGADVNTVDGHGRTALYMACINENPEIVTLLIEHGADVNIADNEGLTPLYEACYRNNLEIATLIVNNYAEVDLSSLKAFVRYYERDQIDEIINNPPQEPSLLHLAEGANTEILDLLIFPHEFQNSINLIGNEGGLIDLHFAEVVSHYIISPSR